MSLLSELNLTLLLQNPNFDKIAKLMNSIGDASKLTKEEYDKKYKELADLLGSDLTRMFEYEVMLSKQ